MTRIVQIAAIILFSFLFNNCSDNKSPVSPISQKDKWIRVDDASNYDLPILACLSSDDTIVIASNNLVYCYTASEPNISSTRYPFVSFRYFSPPMNYNYCVTLPASANTINSFCINEYRHRLGPMPYNSFSSYVSLSMLKDFSSMALIQTHNDYFHGLSTWSLLNSRNDLFFIVSDTQAASLCLFHIDSVNVNSTGTPNTPFIIKKTSDPAYNGKFSSLVYMGKIGECFVAAYNRNWSSYNPSSYCIAVMDTLGNCVFDTVDNFVPYASFKYKGNYYIGDSLGNIYTSSTFLKWESVAKAPLLSIGYTEIDSVLCATSFHQLFAVDIAHNTYRELDNEGIQDQYVTGIAKCGDYVWVTTYGGIFRKSFKSFFDNK
ncbi:MAG: hypothetical protein JNL74_03265 [Fibrobacteres bacterium]|nr:hypothetical protein [Fibrobacterota bacterium]